MDDIKVSNEVLEGSSKYLFLWGGSQKQFSFLLEKEPIKERSINNFYTNISSREFICNSRGIDFLHVIFPSKPLVKNNFLPSSLKVTSIANKFINHDKVFYPLEELKELELDSSTFKTLDTHMTDFGYFSLVNKIVKKLNISSNCDIIVKKRYEKFSGDLAKMINSNATSDELILDYSIKVDNINQPLFYKEINNFNSIDGNEGRISISYTLNSCTSKRLVIFGDSFFYDSLKYLRLYFQEIIFVRTPFLYEELIDLISPDIILTGNAERYCCGIPNDFDSGNFFYYKKYLENYNPSNDFVKAFTSILSFKYKNNLYSRYISSIKAELFNKQCNYYQKLGFIDEAILSLEKALSNCIGDNKKILDKLNKLKECK